MKILISGGGIAGLTLALTAKKAGHHPIILQHRQLLDKPSFGGGIGLWPPSQLVMDRLGILKQLQDNALYMPGACYYDSNARPLALPTNTFHHKFPVACLQRQQLSKSLFKKCVEEGVQIRINSALVDAVSYADHVEITLENGQKINGDILVGSDGIWSRVRSIIMKQRRLPQIVPYHCEYAYFRAVVDVSQDRSSQWHRHAFQSWGQRKRFGYVPLKSPKTFWFVAIPIGYEGLQKMKGSQICTADEKQWILKQFSSWYGPVKIGKIIQLTPAETILRTDIHKVKNVTQFPWHSEYKNMIILGDAANATAPNLAQGAGLAIESAWDLVSMVNFETKKGLDQYIRKRKKRAQTVQFLADTVANVGQLPKPYSSVRNFVFANATRYLKPIESRIFQQTVSYSVGGSLQKLHWLPPNIPADAFHKNITEENCILGQITGKQSFQYLPQKTKKFRSSLMGCGSGKVSVKSIALSTLLGLPDDMTNSPFGAYVQTYITPEGVQYQNWTRVFGQGRPKATKFATIHRATPNLSGSSTGLILTQTLGIGPDIFRFGYLPVIQGDTIYYESKGLWLRNFKLPIPSFLLPSSTWKQKQNENGWQFAGVIRMPKILGAFNIMDYSGSFVPEVISREIKPIDKKVVIAGGSGMIGRVVAQKFYLKGWNVEILSRGESANQKLPFVKYHSWNPKQFTSKNQIQRLAEIFGNADLIVNLSGQNPGAASWTPQTKRLIIDSRLNSIKLITSAISELKDKGGKNPIFLQASAAGIYGDRKGEILHDDANPHELETFRVTTCKQIENLTRKWNENMGLLRIGHVLSSQGGLFPSLQLASKMRASRFGRGGQYAPWIHIQDLASSIVHISENFGNFKGKTINLASPQHKTYDEILATLAKVRGRRLCVVPVPHSLLSAALGEMSSILFDSQRMHPKLLIDSKFEFQYANLEKSLTSRQCL